MHSVFNTKRKKYIFHINESVYTMSDLITVFLKTALGTGFLKLGTAFSCGFILSIAMCVIISFFSYYSMFLYVKSSKYTERDTFEGIWAISIGTKSSVIPSVCSIISALFFVVSMLRNMDIIIKRLINEIVPDLPEFATSSFIISLILGIIFWTPMCFSSNVRSNVFTARIGLLCVALLILYVFGNFCRKVHNYGIDPKHEVVYAKFDLDIFNCMSYFFTAFMCVPLAWPGMRHLRDATEGRILGCFKIYILITCFVLVLMGICSYFTFLNQTSGDMILDLFQDGILTQVGYWFLLINMVCTLPTLLNPSRFIFLNMVDHKYAKCEFFWQVSGFFTYALPLFLSLLEDPGKTLINATCDALAPILMFVFPAFLYLVCTRKKKNKTIHKVGAVLILVFGLLGIAMMISLYL